MKKIYIVNSNEKRIYVELDIPVEKAKEYPLVILLHGLLSSSHMKFFDSLTHVLNTMGVAVLRFDFNGHGMSEGAFEDITVDSEINDAMIVYSLASKLPNVQSIHLLGHSQGGVISILMAERLYNKIKSLVLLAPAISIADDARAGNLMGRKFDPRNVPSYIKILGKKVKREFIISAQDLNLSSCLMRYKGPLLLLYGEHDYLIPPISYKNFAENCANAIMRCIKNANHDFSTGESEALQEISTFYCERLFGKATIL